MKNGPVSQASHEGRFTETSGQTGFANDLRCLSPQTRRFLDRPLGLFIGGAWVQSDGADRIAVIDPTSGQCIAEVPAASAKDVDRAVNSASATFHSTAWRGMRPVERERMLVRLADLVEAHATLLAELEAIDVGMPLRFADEIYQLLAVDVLRYMAGMPTKIKGEISDVSLPGPDRLIGYTLREPVGVVGAILPWNSPGDAAIWKVAAALAAGCTVVVKPSEMACLTALALGDLVAEAGFPPGAVNIITGTGAVAGHALASHPGVQKIGFTGSTQTGRLIQAAAIPTLKKVHLELGGKSPALVFADADLPAAAKGVAEAIYSYSGQLCVAGSRLYVQDAVYDEVTALLVERSNALLLGPSLSRKTDIGPLVRKSHLDKVAGCVDRARDDGATILCGGAPIDGPGYYYPPTVIADVRQDMACVQDEIFGPVITVSHFSTPEEALTLANDTTYGLAAYVWSSNISTIHDMVGQLRCGKVAVNSTAPPIPSLPEGGTKGSGYGRDLGLEGLNYYLETKSVLMRV